MSILEQVDAFLKSDKSNAYPIRVEDGYLFCHNLHWSYYEPYVVANDKAIILESDKNGSIKKGVDKTDIKSLLDRNGFNRPKAVLFKEIEGVLIYQDDQDAETESFLEPEKKDHRGWC